jgi:hypothetical protein
MIFCGGVTCHYFFSYINMDLLISIFWTQLLWFGAFCMQLKCTYNLKVSLCHLVFWQPMACEWFPKDPNEFLNLNFISNFALIHVSIVSLQNQILLC